MFDTSVFNRLKDGAIPVEVLTKLKTVYVTHIQRDELIATDDPARRSALLAVFRDLGPEELATESTVWDVSSWDKAKWSANDGIYESLLARIKALDGRDRGDNQIRDALIAETAIKVGLTLVTDDIKLTQAVREHRGRVVASGVLMSI